MRFKQITVTGPTFYPYGFKVAAGDGAAEIVKGPTFLREVHAWCSDQFGPDEPGQARWSALPSWNAIFFRDETDAVAFRIRWG